MVRDPLDDGVGENDFEALAAPAGDVGDFEGDVGHADARGLDHVEGAVDADDFGLRIALAQHGGRIPGAAADVGGAPDVHIRDAGHKVAHRPRALLLELDVLRR